MKRVAIVGGGASGMAAAISFARFCREKGVSLTDGSVEAVLYDANGELGKKLLLTGNGKCNFSNENLHSKFYFTDCDREDFFPAWIKTFLGKYETNPVQDFLREFGIVSRSVNGCLYPASGQASTVRDALSRAVTQYGVKVVMDTKVNRIVPKETAAEGFDLEIQKFAKKTTEHFDTVILAAGSCAYPKTGSDGSGYMMAQSLGLQVNSWHPSLCPVLCGREEDSWILKAWNGVRNKGTVYLFKPAEKKMHLLGLACGEIQLTDYGLSGIPVFQVSRYVSAEFPVKRRKEEENTKKHYLIAMIDWYPEMELPALMEHLRSFAVRERENNSFPESYLTAADVMNGLVNNKLSAVLLKKAKIDPKKRVIDLNPEELAKFAEAVKAFDIVVTGSKGYDMSQVCAGGADLYGVNPVTMESQVTGVYLTGEMIDLDGWCGGYNLHAAFLSGMRAGKAAAKRFTEGLGK